MRTGKPRVVLADFISGESLQAYRALPSAKHLDLVAPGGPAHDDLVRLMRTADFLLVRRRALGAAAFTEAKGLRAVVVVGERVDLDQAALEARGVLVERRPRLTAHAVADLVFAMMLVLSRDLLAAHRGVAAGAYRDRGLTPQPTTETQVAFNWLGLKDEGPLFGKTMGLIGLGEIGCLIAVRARAFGMNVCYHKRRPFPPHEEERLGVAYRSLPQLLSASDFVSAQVPDTVETRGMLGFDQLRSMRPTSYLINASRGRVVDETALAELLRDGRIAGAGLDVFCQEPLPSDSPLAALPNVILSPHIGGGGTTTLLGEMESAFARILALWKGAEG